MSTTFRPMVQLSRAYVGSAILVLRVLLTRWMISLFGSGIRASILNSLTTLSGSFQNDRLSLFSVVKNEIFLLPSFLSHHRDLGVEQFVILVDESSDGTLEFLKEQEDVVVLECGVKFGHEVNESPFARFGGVKMSRASNWLKEVISDFYFRENIALYLDADEFLFLPPGVDTVRQVAEHLRARKALSLVASVVEFFPSTIAGLEVSEQPKDFGALLAQYPYFDAHPLIVLRENCFARTTGIAKSTELFKIFLGVDHGSVTIKTPLVFHSRFSFRVGSHIANFPPLGGHVLTIAHFKFTAASQEKFREVIESDAHLPYTAKKYDLLENLLLEMKRQGASFRCSDSVRFNDPQQFVDCGLMTWPE